MRPYVSVVFYLEQEALSQGEVDLKVILEVLEVR